jgi:hypothetical protein
VAAHLQFKQMLGSCNDASAARSYARRHTEDVERSIPRPQPDFEDAEWVLHDLGISPASIFRQFQPLTEGFDRNESASCEA